MNPYDELHAYVDGEVDAAEKRRIEAFLASDPEAARHVESIRAMKAAIARHAVPVECRATWKSCQDRLSEIDRARRTERFVSKNAWAICACFGLAIVGAGWWHKANAPRTLQNADFVQAVAGFGGGARSDQPQVLNQYMDALLRRARKAQSSDAILGADQVFGVVDGHRFVKMRLTDKSGDMWMVCVEDEISIEGLGSSPGLPGLGLGKMGSYNCVQRSDDGHTVLIAGDRDYAALSVVMDRVCGART